MHLGKQENPSSYTMMSNGSTVVLESTALEKDLGVNVDKDLNFENHIQIQTKKANQLLGMIRRTFTHLDNESLSLLYKAIVRPHLEYGNVVWHPRWKKDKEELESVQHRATKLLPNLKEMSYRERLETLKLPSLYYRRARGDMIECYKYLSGIYDVSTDFLPLNDKMPTRGHSLKLRKLSAEKPCRAHFFSRRITNAWNALPESVVTAATLNCFKARLDKHWDKYHYCTDTDWYTNPMASTVK